MPNFNRVVLVGHLTRDPEVKTLPSGTTLAEFGIAVNRSWKIESGERKDKASFFDCKAFGKRGEVIAQYLKKGQALLVEGELEQERWEAKDGTKRSRVTINVTGFTFLAGKSQGERDEAPPAAEEPPPSGDDIPF